jgi:hypothetical protein
VNLLFDDGFGLQVFFQSQHTTFPSDAGLFESAEGGEWIMVQCIDQNPTRIYLCGNFSGSLQIGGTNISQQSIYRVDKPSLFNADAPVGLMRTWSCSAMAAAMFSSDGLSFPNLGWYLGNR